MKRIAQSVPRRILLIDDDEGFLQVMTNLLLKHGYVPVAASSGQQGIGLAATQPPDLILCDLEMPAMNGYEVLAALRGDPKLAEIPVLFLTGLSEPDDVRRGMNLGADDYLTKPVNQGDLLQAIRVRLQRRRESQERLKAQEKRALKMFAGALEDLRDPLFTIMGYTDLLKPANGGPSPGPADPRPMLDHIQQAATRMQGILVEILFLARSKMQKLPFDPGPLELREFCQRLLAEQDQRERIRFECELSVCPIVGDALRLRQALENLVSNALKYSDGMVRVRLAAEGQRYSIEISDTGIGIPAGDQPSIFEPFFRGSNAGARPGHGLGLCVARDCIQQHGGAISFTSQINEGARFVISLPASPPAPASTPTQSGLERAPEKDPVSSGAVAGSLLTAPVRPGPQTTPAGGPKPIGNVAPGAPGWRGIIVDDDPLARGVLRDLLEREGGISIIGEAGSVRQARFLVGQQQPAVVFLDVSLPDGSGFDLLRTLKPTTSVVIVTSAEEYAAQAFDCEATDYLLKPISPERLQKALQRVRQRLEAKTTAASRADSSLVDSFLVKTLTERRLVKVAEIKSILAYGEYSWVYWHQNTKGALLRKPLKQWQLELPREQFIRIHRRAIVNLAFLDRVERLPGGRLQVYVRDMAEPIMASLSQTPTLNRRLSGRPG